MTEHQTKMPKRRFKGYTGEWEEVKLGDVASMKARIGWQGLTKGEFLDKGDYYLITGTDFQNGSIKFEDCHYIGEDRYKQDVNIQIRNTDVLITKDGTIGKVAYVKGLDKPATLNAGVFVLRGKNKNINQLFLYHYLAAPFLLDYANMQATGGTIKHLNQNVLVDFPMYIPSFEEQQKIGEFFSELDERIDLQKSKVDKMKALKKAYLSEMFPAEGETTPKRRFKGFTGEWEEKNFQEVYSNIPTKPYQIKTSEVLEQGEYEVVDQGKERVCGYSNNHEKVFHNLPIIIYGDHTTYIKFRDEKFIIGADGTKLLGNKNTENDLKFLFYALEFNNITPEGYKRHFSILKEIELYIPTILEEQQKIGEFFSELDEMIELHEEKLKKLQDLKQAYLNELLI